MFRIAMISRWHPHAMENRYVNQLKDIPEAEIAVVWDDDTARGEAWAKELHVDFEKNLEAVLSRDDIDGICITAPTNQHKDIIVKAAKAGKHIFTEKALAMNYEEALEVKKVIDETGVELGVVFPRRANREYLYAKKLYDAGEFGEVALMRVRNAVTNAAVFEDHWFKAEPIGGGGAIRDLGCHNIDLVCWILGEPASINATAGYIRHFAVDDTGVCNIKFQNGAIAIIDSTFSAPLCNNWYSLEIYGSKLAFIADPETVTMIHADGTKEEQKIKDMPEGYPLPIQQWINACTGRGENICTVDAGVLVNKVLDAAEKSLKNACTVKI